LLICSRDENRIWKAARAITKDTGNEVLPLACDLSTAEGPDYAVEAALEHYGRVDVLVTNTGGPPPTSFASATDNQWTETFQSLFMSVERLVRATLPGMLEHRWGRIISVTSCACREPVEGLILSNSIRLSIHGLLKSLTDEYGSSGVTFNSVLPGYTRTARMEELATARAAERGITPDEVFQAAAESIPMRRAGGPDEIAAAVVFLASVQASYITGTSLPVDGGRGRFVL
jgi:3-oxoacyl-[acyl-carrier protein] reductase